MTTQADGRLRRTADRPAVEVIALVAAITIGAIVAFLAVLEAFPVDRSIATPFALGPLDPIAVGILLWIGVALATSSQAVADEGRVTVIYGVGPIVGAWAIGGPAAGVWVALIGTFELRELRGGIPWYGVMANHAMQVIPAAIGGVLTLAIRDLTGAASGDVLDLVAVLAGASVFWLIGLGLSVLTVWARNRRTPREAVGVPWRTVATMIAAESALAWIFALAYRLIAWWSPIVFVLADVAAAGSLGRARADWLSRHHQITQLPNRAALADRAKDLRRAGRRGAYVFYLDLDGFKAVNDAYDHDTGDAVLRVIADRLAAAKRGDDFLAHFHGDEFVVLAAGVNSDEEADVLVDRLIAAVEVPIHLPEGAIQVSASIGYHSITDLRTIDDEIRHADRRMAAVKRERASAAGRVRRAG